MLYHAGDSWHTQNIQINNVIGENEKCVFYFMEKTKRTFLAHNTFHYFANDPLMMILLSFCLVMVLCNLEILVFKAEMLSQGHEIVVQVTLMLGLQLTLGPLLPWSNDERRELIDCLWGLSPDWIWSMLLHNRQREKCVWNPGVPLGCFLACLHPVANVHGRTQKLQMPPVTSRPVEEITMKQTCSIFVCLFCYLHIFTLVSYSFLIFLYCFIQSVLVVVTFMI